MIPLRPLKRPFGKELVLAAFVSARIGIAGGQHTGSDLVSQGAVLMQSGDYQHAAEKFREAVRLEPGSVSAHYNLALALVRLRREKAAIEELETVTKLDSKLDVAHYNLAVLLEQSGQFTNAIRELQTVRELNSDDPAPLIHLAGDYFRTGQSSQALSAAHQALQHFSEPKVKAQIGALLLQNGHAQEAVSPLEDALHGAPDSAPVLARALLSTGRLSEASAVLHQALERDGSSVETNLMLGIAEADLHGASAAQPYIEKALRLDPRSALGYDLLGNLYLRAGNYAEAAKNYQTATQLASENDLYAYGAALALERLDKTEEAIPYAQTAVRLRPERAINCYLLGKLYEKTGRDRDAIRELKECVHLNPQADAAYYLLARIYSKSGDPAEAAAWMEKFDKLKSAHDQTVGLMTPASESLSIENAPAPWDRVH